MEFFEKQKYQRRMKLYGKQGEQKLPSKPSLDLVSLQMATLTAKQFQSKDKNSKSSEQRNRVNMERHDYNHTRLHRRQNVELPMSPNATPSILQLGDDLQSSTEEPQASTSLHNFRRDIKLSIHYREQESQVNRHTTHEPTPEFVDHAVSQVTKSTARGDFPSLSQQQVHNRKNFFEDVFFQFPSSSKDTEWHDDSLPPSHLPQSHGASSAEMSVSSDTSEDSPPIDQDSHVKQHSEKLIRGEKRQLAEPSGNSLTAIPRTSFLPDVPTQSESGMGSSLENFRKHFRAEYHKGGMCRTPSPICLESSPEGSPKQSSVGSIDLLCHETTNFTSPESVYDLRQEKPGKFGRAQMPGREKSTTGEQLSENIFPSRWHAGIEVQACQSADTDQHPQMRTTLGWQSVCTGGVPQEPQNLCGDVPTSDGHQKEGSLPVPSKSSDVPYGGNSVTRAVLKEVLDLDAELNGHLSPEGQYRPLKRCKVLPVSVESFSLSVPSTLDESYNLKETTCCEEVKTSTSNRNTPPVSPFTRDVQKRALESIALFTPKTLIAKLENAQKIEEEKGVSEMSDLDNSAQDKSSALSGQIDSEGGKQEASSVIRSSLISQDRGIQCQLIASIQPTMKEQSTQSCPSPNSGVKRDVETQTCKSLQCDAGIQWKEQAIPDKENEHSHRVCDSFKTGGIFSDDADVTDSKETRTSVASAQACEESQGETKGKSCPLSAEGKTNLEDGGKSSELLSQSTCSDSFDSCTSV